MRASTPRWRLLAAAAALMALCAVAVPQAARAQLARPNVIVIMTDDQTVADMQAMPLTSRALGRKGVTFRRSFVSYPVCCPSRATFLTGQYAHNHNVLGLYPPTGGYGRFNDFDALPVFLRRRGWHTVHMGKYLNGYGIDRPIGVPPGWSEWYGAVDPSTYRMWNYTLNENGRLVTYGGPDEEHPFHYQTDVLRDKALDVIRRKAAAPQPLFLSLAFLAPHHEEALVRARTGVSVRPAQRHRGAFAGVPLRFGPDVNEADVYDKPNRGQRRAPLNDAALGEIAASRESRLESLLAVDEAVRDIVRTLSAVGALENTWIIFTSDNGFFYGEHRVPSGKMLPYDPSTAVPLLIRGPGLPRGKVAQELVANTDLAPTILEIAGMRMRYRLDGRSLLPYARDPQYTDERAILHETGGQRYLPPREEDPGPFGPIRQVLTYNAVRTARYLYVRYKNGSRELYDLQRDPYQLNSLHLDRRYRATRNALYRELQRLVKCRGVRCRKLAGPIPDPKPIADRDYFWRPAPLPAPAPLPLP